MAPCVGFQRRGSRGPLGSKGRRAGKCYGGWTVLAKTGLHESGESNYKLQNFFIDLSWHVFHRLFFRVYYLKE